MLEKMGYAGYCDQCDRPLREEDYAHEDSETCKVCAREHPVNQPAQRGNQMPDIETVTVTKAGDFYNAYDADAKVLSMTLGLTLQVLARDGTLRFCGLPAHCLDGAKKELAEAGIQLVVEEPSTG